MAHPRSYDDRPPGGGYRSRMPDYDDRYDRYDQRDGSCNNRNSPPLRSYDAPNDSRRTPPRRDSGRNSHADSRSHNDRRDYDDWDRGRGPRSREEPSGYRRGYRDRDREGYRSPSYSRSRSQSRSRSPRRKSSSPYYGGAPSKEVMMDNVPLEFSATDVGHHHPIHIAQNIRILFQIRNDLKKYYHINDLEDIRIIKDHQTKQSRGFGFLRFPTLEKAKAFVEQNYPTLVLGDESSDSDSKAAKIRIQYSRERGDRSRTDLTDSDWVCKNCNFTNFAGRRACHKCQARFGDTAMNSNNAATKQPEFMNSGDSDVSTDGSPSQFLILRSLEPTVTEELLAKGVAKLYKPNPNATQTTANQPKKGAKVASTTGDANLGAREGSLRRIMLVRDRRTNESWRYGFAEYASVEDAQAALTRYNSFVKFTIASKPVIASYIHSGVFVPVFNFDEGYEAFTFSPFGNTATRLQYWDEGAYVSELVVSVPEERPAHEIESQARSATDEAALAAQKEGLVAPSDEVEAKPKKRKTEVKDSSKTKKATPAHLQFWSDRHAELHGIKPKDDGTAEDNGNGSSAEPTPDNSDPKSSIQSYANLDKMCCYLCSRQFKTVANVNKHERLSDLHRNNLNNEELKNQAITKMKKAGVPIGASPQQQEADDTPEYRDRAKERRAAYGTSKKISLPMKKQASGDVAKNDENDKPSTAPKSKGAALLGKMGWSSGQGLGAQGEGMTAPIATDLYIAGVGLGAEGGKVGDAAEEAARSTRGGYSEFLERTRDKAKERFESMK